MSEWIDISVPLRTGMASWPGDPPVRITRVSDMENGDGANLTQINMSAHSGTHVDAPLHFYENGKSIEEIPFSALIGPARVIEITDPELVREEVLAEENILPGERILFKTRNSTRNWPDEPFTADFVYLETDAARFLAESRVRTIGVDYLSVAGYGKNEAEAHRALLGAGIWVIEGLYMDAVSPGNYEMICLPIRLAESDGAPVRAVVRAL
ncbi:MAG: cyclase family protein [Desulfobacterales bacterium]|nr:cyclase family protein [Desulfobacterales bacterium]